MTDFLDEKREEINRRLAELKPAADEYARLEQAVAALAGIDGAKSDSASTSRPARRGPGRPRGTTTAAATSTRRRGRPMGTSGAKTTTKRSGSRAGRRKGTGERSAQALKFVTEQPGITIPELAAKMGIKQNYLYRVLPGLEQESKIKKDGRGWHPAK
jgi:hypothetical protein